LAAALSDTWSVTLVMGRGELHIYARGQGKQEVVYEVSSTPYRLGGLGNPTTVSLLLTPPMISDEVEQVLLDVALSHSSKVLSKWRIWFDGVAISREYKPHVLLDVDDRYYSKVVYDLTPIYKPGVQHRVGIKYEGSSPVTVEEVGLLVVYRVEDSYTYYSFASGCLALAPGEEAGFELAGDCQVPGAGRAVFRVVASMPCKNAVLRLEAGDVVRRVKGYTGVGDFEVELPKPPRGLSLRIVHEDTGGNYYPRHVVVSSLLSLVYRCKEPRLEAMVESRGGGSARIKIVNSGDAAPDKAFIVVLAAGRIIRRVSMGRIQPGEERIVEIPLEQGYTNIVRLVWSYHGRTGFKDLKVQA